MSKHRNRLNGNLVVNVGPVFAMIWWIGVVVRWQQHGPGVGADFGERALFSERAHPERNWRFGAAVRVRWLPPIPSPEGV